MNTFDRSSLRQSTDLSLLWQSTAGLNRPINLMGDSIPGTGGDNCPPCNIERAGEDHYQISLALAGFTPDEVTFTAEPNVLTIEGLKVDKCERRLVDQSISSRPFRRVFNLADYVNVKGTSFENSMLKIDLVREVPEAPKLSQTAINAGGGNQK